MQQRRDKTPGQPEGGSHAGTEPAANPQTGPALAIDEGLVFVVHAGKTRHPNRPRQHWRESEYAQVAMRMIHHGVPPRDVDRTKLWREVNAWLAKDSGFQATGIGEISRKTVVRELLKLQQQP
jgi:hypothetical protein